MGKGLLLIGCLALGAAGGFAASLVAAPGLPSQIDSAPAAGREKPTAADPVLRRLERRVDALSNALRAQAEASYGSSQDGPDEQGADDGSAGDDQIEALDGSAVTTSAAAKPNTSLAGRLSALERRVATLEKSGGVAGPAVPANLAQVGTKELATLAGTLSRLKRYDDAKRVLKEALRRGDLDADQRTQIELQLGYSLRGLGQHAEAEERFLETLGRVGEDTEAGAAVGFQVGWERYYQKDFAGASERMERTANASGVSKILRVHGLYNAANFAKQAGDTSRALTFLERLLNNHVDDIPPSQAYMKTQAEAWQKELRGY